MDADRAGRQLASPVVRRPSSVVVADMPDRHDPRELAPFSFVAVLGTTPQASVGRLVSHSAGWHTHGLLSAGEIRAATV